MEQITIPFSKQQSALPQELDRGVIKKSSVEISSKEALHSTIINPQQAIENTFNSIFLDNKEENKLQRARTILGEVTKDQVDDELKTFVTELQYLIDSWLDDYEQQVFEGMTLKQLLKES